MITYFKLTITTILVIKSSLMDTILEYYKKPTLHGKNVFTFTQLQDEINLNFY